jgi:hypothetical protein
MPSTGRASYESCAGSDRLLHFWTLGAIIVMIAIVITFPLQPANVLPSRLWDAGSCGNNGWPYAERSCRDDAAGKNRSIRLVSPDRIPKTTIYTAAARVEIPTVTPSQAVEPVLQAPAAVNESAFLPPSAEHAAPLAPSVSSKIPVVSPRARAEMPPSGRNKSGERQPALALELAPREKSFTGAGATFDAVH